MHLVRSHFVITFIVSVVKRFILRFVYCRDSFLTLKLQTKDKQAATIHTNTIMLNIV